MADILKQILKDKRIEVEQRKKETPVEVLQEKIGPLPKCRNFYTAVTRRNPRGINVIAEVKKASPSAGVIRENFDPVEIALTYERCGAEAVSVLTDEKYFQGRLEYLTAVKDVVSLPVLRKDFIIDEYQIYEARAAGAEALTHADLMDLLILASRLTLTALIEVHGADSLLRVRSLIGFPQKHYSVLGINNRDLVTMQVDINNTGRLAELVENPRQVIAESGIRTRGDVEKLIRIGVGGVLIGRTLCESDSIEEKFKELFDIRGRK
jgi:indole-3-glycerol phosphate synthase